MQGETGARWLLGTVKPDVVGSMCPRVEIAAY